MISHLISKLFNSLNEEKINYAILRNYDSMPNKPKEGLRPKRKLST